MLHSYEKRCRKTSIMKRTRIAHFGNARRVENEKRVRDWVSVKKAMAIRQTKSIPASRSNPTTGDQPPIIRQSCGVVDMGV
jgi:hypothetical protein